MNKVDESFGYNVALRVSRTTDKTRHCEVNIISSDLIGFWILRAEVAEINSIYLLNCIVFLLSCAFKVSWIVKTL